MCSSMHAILITFSISQVIQAALAVYLWVKLHQKHPLLITAEPYPSAPPYDDRNKHQ